MLLEGNNGSDFVILSLDGGEPLLEPLGDALGSRGSIESRYFLGGPKYPESIARWQ